MWLAAAVAPPPPPLEHDQDELRQLQASQMLARRLVDVAPS